MPKRAPGNPQGGLTFGNVPTLPGANFGGPAGDIASALGSFTGRLRELGSEEDLRAFRDAQAELEQQRFTEEQGLTRELAQLQVGEQQKTRAAGERRADIRSTETLQASELAAAQAATQAELDRALTRDVSVGAPEQETELARRRSAMAQIAVTALTSDRSPEQAALLVQQTFKVTPEEALISVQEAQALIDQQAQQIALREVGSDPLGLKSMGGEDFVPPADPTPAPTPPPVSTGGVPGQDPFAAFMDVGAEEEPSPDMVVDALLQQNMSGTDIISLLEREGADDEEMETVKTILRTRGIPFVESQLDAQGPSQGPPQESQDFLSRLSNLGN